MKKITSHHALEKIVSAIPGDVIIVCGPDMADFLRDNCEWSKRETISEIHLPTRLKNGVLIDVESDGVLSEKWLEAPDELVTIAPMEESAVSAQNVIVDRLSFQ